MTFLLLPFAPCLTPYPSSCHLLDPPSPWHASQVVSCQDISKPSYRDVSATGSRMLLLLLTVRPATGLVLLLVLLLLA